MKRVLLAVALCAGLAVSAGCAVQPTDPAQAVYLAQGDYLAALTAAVKYKQLPPCGQPSSPTLCSDPTVVSKLQVADDVAYSALTAAQAAVRAPAAPGASSVQSLLATANTAIQAFATAVASIGGK
jgi:hypothetical protein